MHYSISLQTTEFRFLSITSRKKLLKHCLLRVEEGLALVRLGKHEFAVEAGKLLWLPFDCLTSISYLPQTKVSMLEVSSRVQTKLPTQAGFVVLNELATALFNRLAQSDASHEQKQDLYRVLLTELPSLNPMLQQSKLGKRIAQWSPDQPSDLEKELQLVLRVREARRRVLSGGKLETVINELFAGDHVSFSALTESVYGKASLK